MATITTRVQGDSPKGSPLTNAEVDNNFINLNTAKYESGDNVSFGTGAFSGGVPTGGSVVDHIQVGSTSGSGLKISTTSVFQNDDIVFFDAASTLSGQLVFSTGGASRLNISSTEVYFNHASTDTDFRIESDSNANIFFVNAGTNRIGMGTNSPTGSLHLLDVKDSAGADVYYVAQNTTANRIAGYKVLDESGNRVWQGYYDNGGNRGGLFIELPTLGNADIGFDGTTFEISSNSSSAKLQLQSASIDRLTFYATSEAVFNDPGNNYDFRVESDGNSNMLFVDAEANTVAVGGTGGWGTLQVIGATNSEYRTFIVSNPADVSKGVGIAYDPTNDRGVIAAVDAGTTWKNLALSPSGGYVSIGLPATSSIIAPLHLEGGPTMTGSWARTLHLEALFPVITFQSTYNTDTYGGIGYDTSNDNMDFWVGATTSDVPADGKRVLRLKNYEAAFNDSSIDLDFRVESDGYTNMLFVDAANNRVQIGSTGGNYWPNANTYGDLQIGNFVHNLNVGVATGGGGAGDIRIWAKGGTERLIFSTASQTAQIMSYTASGFVGNEDAQAAIDFRVESSNNAHMLFVDSDVDRVGVGVVPEAKLHVYHPTKDNITLKLENYLATANGAVYQNYQELLFSGDSNDGVLAGIRQYANVWQNSNSALAFWTQQHGSSYAERMRINGDGTTGIYNTLSVMTSVSGNEPSQQGRIRIKDAGGQSSAGGLEFHTSSGGGAGYGARVTADAYGYMFLQTRANSSSWTTGLTTNGNTIYFRNASGSTPAYDFVGSNFNEAGYGANYNVKCIKLGQLIMQQGGASAEFKLLCGDGYNAGDTQNRVYRLNLRTSNGNANTVQGQSMVINGYAYAESINPVQADSNSVVSWFVEQINSTTFNIYIKTVGLIGVYNQYSVSTNNINCYWSHSPSVETISSIGTTKIEIPAADRQTWLTNGNFPAFQAYKDGGIFETAGITIINGWSESIDNTGHFNAPDGVFTAPVKGHYFFSFSPMKSGLTTGDTQYRLTKNGTVIANSNDTSNGAAWTQVTVTAVIYLNVGDYVRPEAYSSQNSSYHMVYTGTFSNFGGFYTGN